MYLIIFGRFASLFSYSKRFAHSARPGQWVKEKKKTKGHAPWAGADSPALDGVRQPCGGRRRAAFAWRCAQPQRAANAGMLGHGWPFSRSVDDARARPLPAARSVAAALSRARRRGLV